MALQIVLRTSRQTTCQKQMPRCALWWWLRGFHGERRAPESCDPKALPPCPPCHPTPRPACRGKLAPRQSAVLRVCCAPPSGHRPPCPDEPPRCDVTCENTQVQVIKYGVDCQRTRTSSHPTCGGERDRVARRLAAAENVRRLDYEREVTSREPCGTPPGPCYTLGAARQCLRAIDGQDYTLAETSLTSDHCGPGRTPPPARTVQLANDDHCRISVSRDHCAHVPRQIVSIDRTQRDHLPKFSESSDQKHGKSSCPRPRSDPACGKAGHAMRAGDSSWCSAPPQPNSTALPCRPPSLAERLRRRVTRNKSPSREFHTSVTNFVAKVKTNATDTARADAAALEASILEKYKLKEAGRGRVVAPERGSSSQAPVAGQLDLPVPSGSSAVRVKVTVSSNDVDSRSPPGTVQTKSATPSSDNCTKTQIKTINPGGTSNSVTSPSPCVRAITDRRESWLSLRNIQKKLSRREGETAKCPPHGTPPPPPTPVCPPFSPSEAPRCPPPPPTHQPTCPTRPNQPPPSKTPTKPSKKCANFKFVPSAILVE